MTLTLTDEQATALQAKAAAEGLSLEAWIEKLAEPQDSAPTDGASQHDHYIYGWPKRGV